MEAPVAVDVGDDHIAAATTNDVAAVALIRNWSPFHRH